MSLEVSQEPLAVIDGLLICNNPADFVTTPQSWLEFKLNPNGIRGNKRHTGNAANADVRTQAFVKGDTVLNRQSVSVVGADDLDYIGDELNIDADIVYRNYDDDWREALTPVAARRLFLASCMGANVLVGSFRETEEVQSFRDVKSATDIGPFDPQNMKFNNAVLMTTRVNNPCTGPGKKIADKYAGELPQTTARDFVKVAEGRRGFVGMVVKPGVMYVGDTVQFVPLGSR